MRYLRTNTATIVTVGPFYDKTDGVTIETGLTITNERITLVVDLNDGSAPTLVLDNVTGATTGTSNDLNYITNNDAGLMQLELAAANVNYLGRAMLSVTDAANHCPVFHEFTILPAQVYDSLILGTDLLDANASQVGGTAQTGRDVGASVLLSSGTGTGQVSLSSGAVLLQATQTGVTIPTVTTVTNQLTAAAIASGVWKDATAGDFTTASSIGKALYIANVAPGAAGGHFIAGTNAATSITTALTANITGNLSGSVGSVTGAVGSVTGNVGGNVVGSVASVTGQLTAAQIATGIWQDATAGDFTTASSIGKALYIANVAPGAAGGHFIAGTNAATSITTALTTNITGNLSGSVGSVTGAVGSVAGNVDGSVASVASGGITAASIAADAIGASELAADAVAEIADAIWDEAIAGHAGAGSTGAALSAATAPSAAAVADAVWDEDLSGHSTASTSGKKLTDLVNADISGVATATNLATVDTVVDAIKVKTDYLPSAAAGAAGGVFIAGTNAATSVTTALTANITGNLSGSVGSVTGAVGSVAANGITAMSIAADAIGASELAADAVAEIADAIWDEVISTGHATANSAGKIVYDNVNAPIATVDTVVDGIATDVAAVHVHVDTIDAHVTADYGATEKAAIDLLDDANGLVNIHDTVDTVAGYLDTEVAAILAAVDTEVAAILADTNELQTDLVNGGRLDLLIDAIKAKTDNLPASPAAVSDIPTAAAVADAAWDEALSGHTGAGSAGLALATASSGGVDPSVLADAVWDEALSGHSTAGTSGKKLTDLINTDLSGVATATNLATVDIVVDAIKAKTDNLPASPAAVGDIPTAAVITDAVWDEALSGHNTAGTSGKKLTDLINTDLSGVATATNLATVDIVVDAIKVKTDNLPTDPADESLLEAAITAIPSAPTAAAITDAVWDEALSGHTTAGTSGKILADLTSGGGSAPTVGQIDAQLSTTHGSGAWGGSSSIGAGSIAHSITVTDGTNPIDGVDVWITTDLTGTNVVARASTNAFGIVIFMLDAGAYYGWKQLAGYSFTNPQSFTVA
jgi:hypothetical protein